MLTLFSEHGDLSQAPMPSACLHRFVFLPREEGTPFDHFANMDLSLDLDLGVGGDGVIGRRISVYKDEGMRMAIAEGIIGWN